jgi:hypothetical protein
MKKIIILAILFVAVSIITFIVWKNMNTFEETPLFPSNFEECVSLGYPVMESYPRRCNGPEGTFTEDIGNILEKENLIRISQPRPNDSVTSPFVIKGEARGTWFFEASFPITILDESGNIIGQTIAQAKSEWMTEDFVPFEATLNFYVSKDQKGTLILKKDNPSGLPENDDELRIPIKLKVSEGPILGNSSMDEAVTNFLLSQQQFSWKTQEGSNNFCVFQNLNPESDLFPVYIWIRCGEFKVVSGELKELSGTSLPVKIDYPNELSYYDLSKFSYEAPRDGSLYNGDVKRIFPENIWPNLNFDSVPLNKHILSVASKSLLGH